EEEGIAVLQPDDDLPGTRAVDQDRLDRLLPEPRFAADGDDLRARADAVEEAFADEIVVDDDVGLGQTAGGAQREQPRIPGPRADQVDAPGAHRPRSSAAPAARSRSASARPSCIASVAAAVPESSSQRVPSGSLTAARSVTRP